MDAANHILRSCSQFDHFAVLSFGVHAGELFTNRAVALGDFVRHVEGVQGAGGGGEDLGAFGDEFEELGFGLGAVFDDEGFHAVGRQRFGGLFHPLIRSQAGKSLVWGLLGDLID